MRLIQKPILLLICCYLMLVDNVNATSNVFKFRGGPLERCNTYMIIEVSMLGEVQSYGNIVYNKFLTLESGTLVSFDIGLMKNISDKSAYGASFQISSDDDLTRYGIRPRYRYWLNPRLGLDVSTGVFWFSHERYKQKGLGLMLGGSLTYAELFSFDLLLTRFSVAYVTENNVYGNWSPGRESDSRQNLYAGISFHSYAAIVAPIIALVILSRDFSREGSFYK